MDDFREDIGTTNRREINRLEKSIEALTSRVDVLEGKISIAFDRIEHVLFIALS